MDPDPKALAAAVREVRRLTAHLRKTTAPAALLEEVRRDVAALCERLDGHDQPPPYAQRGLDFSDDAVWEETEVPSEFFPYSPVVGPLNPIAPHVELRIEGGEITGEHAFDAQYNGPPGAVHGGVIALVFDELLGTLGALSGVGGFTGTLTIRYVSITPLQRPIRMRARVDRVEGRKTFITGTMHDGDTLCAEATGIFIRPKVSMTEDSLRNARRREGA